MDKKRLILSITIMMALVALWKLGIDYMYRLHPDWANEPAAQVQPAAPQTASDNGQSPTTVASTNPTTSAVASISNTPAGLSVMASPSGQTARLGSDQHNDPTYAMALSIDPNGAGLSSVTLNDFFETSDQKSLYVFQKPVDGNESNTRPLATRSVTVNGATVDLSNVSWVQQAVSGSNSATYAAVINSGGLPALEIDKSFEVFPRNTGDGREGYEIRVTQNFRNLTGKAINVKAALNGTTLPPRESDRSEDRQFIAGFNNDLEVVPGHVALTDLTKSNPTKDLVQIDTRPMLWVGSGSAYFNAIVRPEYAGQPAAPSVAITGAAASGINLDAPAEQRTAAFAIETNEFKLDPRATAGLNLRVFFGPKQRSLLGNDYYSRFPVSYNKTLVITGGFCGFLTFGWLIDTLYYILWFFHLIFFKDWGLAIIGLVCLVRVLLHPITKKSQVNMMQMGKMGPEIERLKKKHGDNKDELNKAMMQVYKAQGMTPVLGCLPMFLQMPIWIALWSALQSTFDLRQAGFLRFGWLHLTWIKDLSHPDALVTFSHPISILGYFSIRYINVLPLLLGVVSFINAKLQPAPANQTPEQEQQRKMMVWMSLLFPVMLYAAPSGLNLYIMTSTTLGIIESKIIRKHIKEREEAEKAGKIIVDAKPTRTGKRAKDIEPSRSAKKGGLMGWIAEIQAKADEVRREAERRSKDRA